MGSVGNENRRCPTELPTLSILMPGVVATEGYTAVVCPWFSTTRPSVPFCRWRGGGRLEATHSNSSVFHCKQNSCCGIVTSCSE